MARFSPDNKYVITGGEDKTINIWETFSGLKLKTLFAGLLPLKNIGFTPDGRYLFAQTDSSLSLWSVPSYRPLLNLLQTRDFVISPDMKFIYAVDFNGSLKKISLSGKQDWVLPLGGRGPVSVSSNGKYVSVITSTGVKLVDYSGKVTTAIDVSNPLAVIFHPDDKTLAILSEKLFYRYDRQSNLLEELTQGAPKFFFSQNSRFVAIANYESPFVTVFDLHNMREVLNFDSVYSKLDTLATQDSSGEFNYKVGTMNISAPGRRSVYNGIRISDNGAYLSSDESLWMINHPDSSYEILHDRQEYYGFNGSFSKDNRYLLLLTSASEVALWDLVKKTFLQRYTGKSDRISFAGIDCEGTRILSVEGNLCKIISPVTGKALHILDKHTANIGSALFSPDGSKILTNSFDTTACLWNANTGALVQQFKGHHYEMNPVYFRRDGELVRPEMRFDTFTVTDPITFVETDALMPVNQYNPANFSMAQSRSGSYNYIALPMYSVLTGSSLELSWDVEVNAISPDEKLFVMARHWTDSIMIGDPAAGKWLKTISVGLLRSDRLDNSIIQLLFSPAGDYLFVTDIRMNVTVLSVKDDYRVLKRLPGEMCSVSEAGDLLVIVNGGKLDLYNIHNLAPLYSYVSMGPQDYLVVDEQKRYDGTARARKYLYFTCENEVIGLDQFKERLWVPQLAGRIIGKDSIYTPGIDKLNICGFTPQVQPYKESRTGWDFEIKPGSGGLGETVVSVNGVEVKRVPAAMLTKTGSSFLLRLDSTEFRSYYVSSSYNQVTIRAFTSDNTVSSRGLERKDSLQKKTNTPPNLHAVMIGVSDYKGELLDLKYAAKDAKDLSGVLGAASRNLLNTDGQEHVFIYEMTTNTDRYRLPEKLAIKKTLEEIGKKATPNDILLIFFAGHGVLQGEQKRFYFLTAEAASAIEGDITDVGISTAELTEWIRPANLKAQKRILIFDACNSGQAIRDIVKIGNEEQGYTAARNDDKAQQAKLIEKLNERSGFTILSAAASNQSAYEMGRYAQGLLTYALLKTVKEDPDILVNGKFLDLGRWFQASGNTVEALIAKDGTRQEPQIVSSTNFIIGIVDNKVLSGIKLPVEKPVFTSSIVINAKENIDNLRLSRLLNAELSDMAASPGDNKIIYIPDADSPGSYSLNGSYTINGNQVSLQVNLSQGETLKKKFEITGSKDNLKELALKVRTHIEKMF